MRIPVYAIYIAGKGKKERNIATSCRAGFMMNHRHDSSNARMNSIAKNLKKG